MRNKILMLRSAVPVVFCMFGFPAAAVPTTCHAIESQMERLACYDLETGFAATSRTDNSVVADGSTSSGTQWLMSEETSSLDNRTDVWLSVPSENAQPNQIGRPEKARLWIRCMGNSTNVFVTFNDYTPDNQNVRYKMDDGAIQKVWMVHMQGGEGIGLWSGKSAIPFTKAMLDKNNIVLAYKSYTNNNLEFTFDISGLRSRIDRLASSCQWQV